MLYDTVDRPKVEELVRKFYAVVLKDDLIGPIFTRALGDDLKNGKWYEHLNTLNNFWLQMMAGERHYRGDPFPPHAFLGPLSEDMFKQWLELFHKTTHSLFTVEIADKFDNKAEVLSKQFIDFLGINDDEDDY